MADVKQLIFSIMKFLEDQKKSGDLSEDSVESLEVAIQCLESAYGVNTQNHDQVVKYQVQRNLLDIFNAQLTLEPDSDFCSLSLHEPTTEEKEEAEKLKNGGNDFMKAEKFSDALECYTKAIRLDGRNAVYFCNRAASYSKLNQHQLAIDDCERALMIDPQYSKAYGRMGIAFTALTDHEGARECYRKALELDPDNQSYQNNLEIAEQKIREQAQQAGFGMGPGGMDFASLLNNPALMNMATSMMANPQMQQMMSNMMSGAQGQGQGQPQGQAPEGGPGAPGGPGMNMGSLLQVGQQLAAQMQQQNPELVAQLRQQMGRNGPPQPPPENEDPGQ